MVLIVLASALVPILPHFQKDELLVLSGGEGHPLMILASARASNALIVNIPDTADAGIAVRYLKNRGIMRAEPILFDSMRKESCGGAYYFLRECEAGTLVFPRRPAKNTFYALSAAHAARQGKIMVSNFSSSIVFAKKGNEMRFLCSGYWKGTELIQKELESGEFEFRVRKGDFSKTFILPRSAEKRIRRIALP